MSHPTGKTASALKKITESLTFRTIIIAIITLTMFIPLAMVDDIVRERGHRFNNVIHQIASVWGEPQTLTGPILAVPYVDRVLTVETVTDKSGDTRTISKDVYTDHTMILLPEELNIEGKLQEEYRKRGIYESLVYVSELNLKGHFNIRPLQNACSDDCKIKWDEAWIATGLTDTKAINEASRLSWDNTSVSISPGTQLPNLISNGFHAPLKGIEPESPLPEFKIRLSINGSSGIRFAPLGEVTIAEFSSAWPHPSFQGGVLPKEKKISAEGFSARWQIPNLARNYPQHWELSNKPSTMLNDFVAGVDLFEPVTLYSKISRSTKYGILFIALTFITFLIFELTTKTRPHFVQYILVGLAMSLFYLILLSLAEHIAFLHAYIAASATTIILISAYAFAILKSKARAFLFFMLLVGLYAVLYTLLHLEDFALLTGTALLLVVTTVLMFVTRHTHRSATLKEQSKYLYQTIQSIKRHKNQPPNLPAAPVKATPSEKQNNDAESDKSKQEEDEDSSVSESAPPEKEIDEDSSTLKSDPTENELAEDSNVKEKPDANDKPKD